MPTEKLGLPSMEHTFSITIQGDETARHYDGQFTYIRPTLHMKAEIAKMKTRLNGDLKTLDNDVQMFNEMYASMFLCIKDAPEWWKNSNGGRDLYDINVMHTVYSKAMEFEQDWQKKVWGDKKKDISVDIKVEA